MSGNCVIIVDLVCDVEIVWGVDELVMYSLRYVVIVVVDFAAKRDVAMYLEKEYVEVLIEVRWMEKFECDVFEIVGVGDDVKKWKCEV